MHKAHTRYTADDARTMRPVCTRAIWGFEHTHYVAAVCDDGVVRRADMGTADTYFSRPAVVTMRGIRTYGIVTHDEETGYRFHTYANQEDARASYRDSIRA